MLNSGKNTLLLTLKVFAATGGIEKVCRVAGKALYEHAIAEDHLFRIYSMYDLQADADDNAYFPAEIFKGYGRRKIKFIIAAVREAKHYDQIVLSHINLLLVGWLIKKRYPHKKLILLAHGIEIWGEIGRKKTTMLKSCDLIIPVSHYTAQKIMEMHGVDERKIKVLNNCLDPFLPLGKEFSNDSSIRGKYGFSDNDMILFTLSRLSSKERYKGYDKVMQALVAVKKKYPNAKYLLAGSYDVDEKKYIDEMVVSLGLTNTVVMTGFIPDEELVAYFTNADVYIMPSMKEGFGIVFIEAMYYGLPVIAGDRDGSVDALCNGELGLLVDPLDLKSIETAIEKVINNKDSFVPDRKLLLENFSYPTYKRKLDRLLFLS
jgi:glycosyltransferase involved in cell wall biosynthesis